MSDKSKIKARTLQAETAWSYQACVNTLRKHACDYDAVDRGAVAKCHTASIA